VIESTEIQHAQVAEREVVAHRIAGIEHPQGCSDLGRHRPAGSLAAGQPQALRHADHVHVERNDEA
jgi:hypothetical protein